MKCSFAFVLLCLIASCATTQVAGEARPRQNKMDSAPAIRLLQESRFEEAESKAKEILAADAPNAQANVVVAIARYKRTLHQLIQDVASVGMGAMRGVNFQYLAFALTTAEEGLATVEKHLDIASTDSNFALDLCLACWKYDWNHNGRIDRRDEALFEIEVDSAGEQIPKGDPRRRPTFHFDLGDVDWARAMVLFQHAALSIVMAYDFSELEKLMKARRERPASITIRLAEPVRITKAKSLILAGLAAAESARKRYLAESDDVYEWVPNPRQKNHPLPLPVDEALYETWGQILADVVRLVQGHEGLDVAQLAQLGEHQWPSPPKGYLDVGHLLDRPGDIVVDLGTLENLDRASRTSPAAMERLLRALFGDAYRPSMTSSPLPMRVLRMKGEIERGQESFERKLRYLIWLN